MEPIGLTSTIVLLAVSLVRGGHMVSMKFALTVFSPLWTAASRTLLAALTVGIWAYQRPIPIRPPTQEWRPLVVTGLGFAIQIAMINYGADLTSPAYAVVLLNSNPIFANLIAHFFVPADRLSFSRALGLVISFGGICVVFLGTPEAHLARNPFWGNLVLVMTAALIGGRTVYNQRVLQWIEPGRCAFWQLSLSSPCLIIGALVTGYEQRLPVTWVPLVALAYQGILVAGVCFTVWVYLLRRHSPGSLTVFSFTVPIFGVVASAWFFKEPLTVDLLIGVAAVAGGIWLVARTPKSRRQANILPEG